jgi:predicted RNase H-like HicB family nuclease
VLPRSDGRACSPDGAQRNPGQRHEIEKAEGNYSAYVSVLPGCVATAATVEEVEDEIRQAIRFYLDGLKEDGLAIPLASTLL